ncbi:CCR4-NOT transcription complex subunit 7, partial [Sphaeroforma arctica JP610]
DTEFPGTVARPVGQFSRATTEYNYQLLRVNVDLLTIIQLGITLHNEKGEVPEDVCTWQFNFEFSLNTHMYAEDSINLLKRSGINFEKCETEGIDVFDFGELLIVSGLVLNNDVRWLSFHGYMDYGYLLKILTCRPLPEKETDFLQELMVYFPNTYDVKYLMKSCKTLKGGLQEVADDLRVERIGPQHQAGSDSLLTGIAFFKMRKVFFENQIDDAKYLNQVFGLGTAV